MIKVSIIGCGKIAGNRKLSDSHTHGRAIELNKNFKLISCYDPDFNKSKQFSMIYNCKTEQNISDIINKSKPEVVSICAPDQEHFEIINKILKNPKKTKLIFVEKPVCNNEKDYKNLLKIANHSRIKVIINHSRRFDANHQVLREKIKNGKLGKLLNCYAYYYSGWIHNGIHIIDTLNFLFNDNFKLKSINKIKRSKYFKDPSIDATIQFLNSKALVEIKTFDEKYYQLLEIELRFENYRIKIENFGKKITCEKKYINAIKENILVNHELFKSSNKVTPMQNAYKNIEKYLQTKKLKYIKDYNLKSSIISMSFMWKVLRKSINN